MFKRTNYSFIIGGVCFGGINDGLVHNRLRLYFSLTDLSLLGVVLRCFFRVDNYRVDSVFERWHSFTFLVFLPCLGDVVFAALLALTESFYEVGDLVLGSL